MSAARARHRTIRHYHEATAPLRPQVDGVAVVASYRMTPPTPRPFRIRGTWNTARTSHEVTIALTEDEARKLVADFASFLGSRTPERRGAHSPQEAATDGR